MGTNAMKLILDQHAQKIAALEQETIALKKALAEVISVKKKVIEKKSLKHEQ